MASQKSKRRSRKRRKPAGAQRAASRPGRAPRREQRAERQVTSAREAQRSQRQLGTVGERPPSPFGGIPVSEIAIFAGLIALVVWLIRGGIATLVVGMVVCTLGVLEVTLREHFSGYRSHTTLLAAIPALASGIGVLSLIGTHKNRAPFLILVAGPIYALLFWQLRKRFMAARQARLARPPAPPPA